jgi:hypothetical protein
MWHATGVQLFMLVGQSTWQAGLSIVAEITLSAVDPYCAFLLLETRDVVFHHVQAQACFPRELRSGFATARTKSPVHTIYAPLRHAKTLLLARVLNL